MNKIIKKYNHSKSKKLVKKALDQRTSEEWFKDETAHSRQNFVDWVTNLKGKA